MNGRALKIEINLTGGCSWEKMGYAGDYMGSFYDENDEEVEKQFLFPVKGF